MAVNFNFSTKTITEAGKYILQLNKIEQVTTKTNKNKIVALATPSNEAGQQFSDIDLWFDVIPKKRELSFWEALGRPDDLETCEGMYVGAVITLNEKDDVTYINATEFFPVNQDVYVAVDTDDVPF